MTYNLEIKDEARLEIIEAYRYYENAQNRGTVFIVFGKMFR